MKKTHNHKRSGYVEAEQFEMRIDGGFALVAESAEDSARIAREIEAERERAERARTAQLSLF